MFDFLKGTGTCLIQIVWFAIGCVQLLATMDFAAVHWGLGSFASFIVGVFLAYIPIVGSIAGFCGAIYAWGWPWWGAGLLFFWPYLLFILFVIIVTVFEKRH